MKPDHNFEIPMLIAVTIIVLLFTLILTGCASNILVSNCRMVEVEGDDKERWLCDKTFSDQWR